MVTLSGPGWRRGSWPCWSVPGMARWGEEQLAITSVATSRPIITTAPPRESRPAVSGGEHDEDRDSDEVALLEGLLWPIQACTAPARSTNTSTGTATVDAAPVGLASTTTLGDAQSDTHRVCAMGTREPNRYLALCSRALLWLAPATSVQSQRGRDDTKAARQRIR